MLHWWIYQISVEDASGPALTGDAAVAECEEVAALAAVVEKQLRDGVAAALGGRTATVQEVEVRHRLGTRGGGRGRVAAARRGGVSRQEVVDGAQHREEVVIGTRQLDLVETVPSQAQQHSLHLCNSQTPLLWGMLPQRCMQRIALAY